MRIVKDATFGGYVFSIHHWNKLFIPHPIETAFAVDVLQNSFIQSQFQTGLVKHLPLIGVSCDKAIHFYRFALTDPVAASLSLWNSRFESS